jgi:hypothetical protein
MPPSDQEPRYQLVDSNGNVVGSLFGDGSGNVVIADETDTQNTFGPDGISTPALEAESVSNIAYAAQYSGVDADARLNNALTDVGGESKIILEQADYTTDHSIPEGLTLEGQSMNGSRFTGGTLSIDGRRCHLTNMGIFTDVVVNSNNIKFTDIYGSTSGSTPVTVDSDDVLVIGWRGGDVTFNSGTSGGLVDSCTGTTFTDNAGSNTQGDIA